MTQLRSALDAFHLPTLVSAIVVAIFAGLSYNGQPVDIQTGGGRTAIVLAVLGIAVATLRTWQANSPAATAPLAYVSPPVAAAPADQVPTVPVGVSPLGPSVPVVPTSPWGLDNNLPGA